MEFGLLLVGFNFLPTTTFKCQK